MEINRISTIGRSFSYKYLTHRLISIIVFLTSGSITVASILHEKTIPTSLLTGVGAGLLIFLLWAISRELDPDNEWGAFLPVVLGLAALSFSERPSILVFLWFLLILRVVNHSTGMPAGIMDSIFITLLGLTMTYCLSWIYGMMTAAVFIIDSQLKDPAKWHLPAGILMSVFSAFIYTEIGELSFKYTIEQPYPVIVGTILFIPFIINTEKLASTGDKTGKELDPLRIKSSRIMAILTFVGIALASGEMNGSIINFMFCIFAGYSIYRIGNNVARIISD